MRTVRRLGKMDRDTERALLAAQVIHSTLPNVEIEIQGNCHTNGTNKWLLRLNLREKQKGRKNEQ